ncbi:MAG: cytochrome C oxidase subunit II [Gemmatimonadota bacterium]
MGKLFAVVLAVITVISAGIFIARIWWLPPDISVLGIGIDHQLMETMLASGVLFVAAQLVLAAFVWRFRDRGDARPIKTFPGGSTPMVIIATVLVGIEILVLSLVGTRVWGGIFLSKPDPAALKVDVIAEQFAYYFRYAGPDGVFGAVHPELINDAESNFFGLDPANDSTARDDVVAASLVIPVNTPVLLTLHSKDVSHAFFVPELRIQQDFVPGLVIPLQFTATRLARKEIVCTQLCGLGHFNMRAYLEVLSPDDFTRWLADNAPF